MRSSGQKRRLADVCPLTSADDLAIPRLTDEEWEAFVAATSTVAVDTTLFTAGLRAWPAPVSRWLARVPSLVRVFYES
jgi:hypothetical protein